MTRRFILLLAIMLGAFVWGTEMRAQSNQPPVMCGCPEGSQEVTEPVEICLGGANFTVEVTYCNRRFIPPRRHPCATRDIDMYTTIKKVCNIPAWANDAHVLYAIHCAMDPAKGNYFNTQASHFTYYSWGPLFCWVVVKPLCTIRDANGCIVECVNECCAVWEEYTLEGGNIVYLPLQDTPDCVSGMCPPFHYCAYHVSCGRPNCDCP